MEGSEGEEDYVDPWEPLVYTGGGATVEDGGENDRVIFISDTSDGNEVEVEGREEG